MIRILIKKYIKHKKIKGIKDVKVNNMIINKVPIHRIIIKISAINQLILKMKRIRLRVYLLENLKKN